MLNERRPRNDKKIDRRKFKGKLQTLAKKAVELNTQHNCEILLIVYSTSKNHWVQYCSSDSNLLFFGCQNATEHLSRIEQYNNTNISKLYDSNPGVDNSISPKPTKHLKRDEDILSSDQPIKIVGKIANYVKSSASTLSTEVTSNKVLDSYPPKISEPPDIGKSSHMPLQCVNKNIDESSSDFDFESYFSNNT